jgi:DNA end-binding protein Ku
VEDERSRRSAGEQEDLELTQFVDPDEIDVFYFEKPYYVVPADDLAEEAYIVLREALRRAKKVAIGQLALRGPRIYRQPEALRARHRAGDAALCRRGQQGA